MKHVALSAGLLLACAGSAQAMGEMILGDSLGVGVKIASGHNGPARLSQFIRNDQILTQLGTVPSGATAFLILGTNDSAGSVKGLEKNIDNIVAAADARKIKLIWVGPPCVRKGWDKNSRDLDAMLTARLTSTSVTYISIRADAELCSLKYTGGDGVHLNMAGYSIMWNKARVAAGLPDSESVKVAHVRQRPPADRPANDVASAPRNQSLYGRQSLFASADDNKPRRRKGVRQEPETFSFFGFFRRNN